MLAERIARREWKPGFVVPNEGDLARELGVSAGTVRKALDLMEKGRLVTRRQGKGTFVKDQASDGVAARFNKLRGPCGERVCGPARPVDIADGTGDEQECRRLGLRAGTVVLRLRRLHILGAENVLVEVATLPAELFPGLWDKGAVCDDISLMAQEYGILLARAEERISIDAAPAAVAAALGVAPETRLMTLDRVIFTFDGRPVEWRMAYYGLGNGHYLVEMS
jgi:GntR family transcriptional regulator